ncbi:hypothetical protein [Eubacterium sp. 1001713B170207_170306_E7]|uniref:hypothetical protein n=1 Tax=Eubacterium sp. 1001713B170207_170306_E7 TaxID=2787097 RepID=UPI001899CE22|nr:hypothetical protein [Eubacterium sp. 1001713B170207_170306_E7]
MISVLSLPDADPAVPPGAGYSRTSKERPVLRILQSICAGKDQHHQGPRAGAALKPCPSKPSSM